MCSKVMDESDNIGFEEATSMIGHSLRSDFSELEQLEAQSHTESFQSTLSREIRINELST
jgi:hypothetical protein